MASTDPRDLFELRMKLRVVRAHFQYDPTDDADAQRSLADLEPLYNQMRRLETEVARHSPTPDEQHCQLHDDTLFGRNNPPEPETYLYHYTRVPILPKIRASKSLRFGPFSSMNDPHEALDIHPPSMGLTSAGRSTISSRDPLVLTTEENERFKATDWIEEINSARRQVKVGAFSMDIVPDLRDIRIDQIPPELVARRLHESRGFAHPRMWAQYADDSRGVCLILDADRLTEAVEAECNNRQLTGVVGPVTYAPAFRGPSLGFIDIGSLLEEGGRGAILDNYDTALLEKHQDWAGEAEYRFLVVDEPDEAFYLPITPGVIAGLIVGPKFDSPKHSRNVVAFARDFEILGCLRQLEWTHGECELNLIDWA